MWKTTNLLPTHRYEDNIKMILSKISYELMKWIKQVC
jgi:hypothetical protein